MNGFAELTYVLCALTALSCTVLLLRAFTRSHMRLLIWSGIFFAALTIENVILFIDMVIFPTTTDLSLLRNVVALFGLMVLLIGLIWDTRAS